MALKYRAIRGVMTAEHTAVTVRSFSQTGFVFGDKPGLFKGKSGFFRPFDRLKGD
jgi:hypothetical protein